MYIVQLQEGNNSPDFNLILMLKNHLNSLTIDKKTGMLKLLGYTHSHSLHALAYSLKAQKLKLIRAPRGPLIGLSTEKKKIE